MHVAKERCNHNDGVEPCYGGSHTIRISRRKEDLFFSVDRLPRSLADFYSISSVSRIVLRPCSKWTMEDEGEKSREETKNQQQQELRRNEY